MQKIFLWGLLCFALTSTLYAGVPTLSPMITVLLNNGDQVTLYGDSDNSDVLYFFPSRLVLKKENGQACFNAILFRGITNLTRNEIIQHSQAGKLGGGIADFMLELQGPTKSLDELKQLIAKQYPQYAKYRLAQVPLVPGSASVRMKHHALAAYNPMSNGNFTIAPEDTSKLNYSLGPVSDQLGAAVTGRFKLSELDALVLMETINKSNFTAAFDVTYTAETRINFPATKVTVEANERRIYNYVETHFKAKGGFFVWSFNTDIRKIRESLTELGDLKVKIDIQNPAITMDFLNNLADKWLENWVMKKMHQTPLDIPKLRAEAVFHEHKNPFKKWVDVGMANSKVSINQFIDKKASFSWEFQGVQYFPVHVKGEFTGLRSANVIAVDYNQSFFTYVPIAAIPFTEDVMKSPGFKEATIAFQVASKDGTMVKRVVNFNYKQMQPYWNLVPVMLEISQDPTSGFIKTQITSDIKYNFSCTTDMGKIELANQPFEYSTSDFDFPSVILERHVGLSTIQLYRPTNIFQSNTELVKIEVVLTDKNGGEFRQSLSEERPSFYYFFDQKQSHFIKAKVIAKYRDGSTKSNNLEIGRLTSLIEISEAELPR